MQLTLVAHAATRAVRDAAFPLDEPLDPQGQDRAAALAGAFRRVDAAWSSPALRARQTAAALRLDATTAPGLADLDCGRWAGSTFDAVQAAEPEAVSAWLADPHAAPHGGESVVDLLARVAAWMEAAGPPDARIVGVTHPAVLRAAMVSALDAAPTAFWRIDAAPLCRLRLRGEGRRWTLLAFG